MEDWQQLGYVGPMPALAEWKREIDAMPIAVVDGVRPARGAPPVPVLMDGTHAFGFLLAPGQTPPKPPAGITRTLPGIAERVLGF